MIDTHDNVSTITEAEQVFSSAPVRQATPSTTSKVAGGGNSVRDQKSTVKAAGGGDTNRQRDGG